MIVLACVFAALAVWLGCKAIAFLWEYFVVFIGIAIKYLLGLLGIVFGFVAIGFLLVSVVGSL